MRKGTIKTHTVFNQRQLDCMNNVQLRKRFNAIKGRFLLKGDRAAAGQLQILKDEMTRRGLAL